MERRLRIAQQSFTLSLIDELFDVQTHIKTLEAGLYLISITLRSGTPHIPQGLRLSWFEPSINTHQFWAPGAGRSSIRPNWDPSVALSKATSNAPVVSLYDASGTNQLCIAASDTINTCRMSCGLIEEQALVECRLQFLSDIKSPIKLYHVEIRLDYRPQYYATALSQVSQWWAELDGHTPCVVPACAELPMYSTWYNFHQQLKPQDLEAECVLAKQLGMDAIIVDDGWQTDDNQRGYAYCGDWEITPNKFPDFKDHVERVQEIGLKYILWFSVPFIGIYAKQFPRFKDKCLDTGDKKWFVLDPRFPEVREYLIDIYERFVTEYHIDGFKLDFVDSFDGERASETGGGRDLDSVPDAVDLLLSETMRRLSALKPDILIEFRQSYIGPRMRKYGNMLRAGDVPNDIAGNRSRTLDIRLLSGTTPAHADMFMWHPEEPVASAALQLLHSFFAVPQVSIMLRSYPPDHLNMIRFLLSTWRAYRDVLLHGDFKPGLASFHYPQAQSHSPEKSCAAAFAPQTIMSLPTELGNEVLFINGTLESKITIELSADYNNAELQAYQCSGELVRSESVHLKRGLHQLDLPASGIIILKKKH